MPAFLHRSSLYYTPDRKSYIKEALAQQPTTDNHVDVAMPTRWLATLKLLFAKVIRGSRDEALLLYEH